MAVSIHTTKPSKSLKEMQENVREGIRYRTLYGQSKSWKIYKNMYRGIWAKGVVPVNIMFSIERAMIPQVYFRNPRVSVMPTMPGFGMHAMLLERLDNYLIKETGIKQELKSSVMDCFFSGRGPGIIGYDSEYGFNPSFAADEFQDSSLSSFNKKGERIEYNYNVKPGMPWYLRANPEDFVVPWGTSTWRSAPWFAFRKMRILRDCKEDPKFKNTNNLVGPYRSSMEGSHDGAPEKVAASQFPSDNKQEWVELWQYHDQRSGRVFTFTLDHPKYLRDEIDYLQTEGLPARVLGFNEDPDHFWWIPDARIVKPRQDEINDIRTMAKKHRRVAILKVLYDKSINKDELAKLMDSDVKAAVGIDVGIGGDIRKAVAFLQSHVPPDFTIAAREVREDTREEMGFSRNQSGSFEAPSGRRTAHEAEIVNRASMIRIDERKDALADHLESIVRAYNQIVFSNWSARRVIDIVGPDGARYWVKFSGKEIKGEYHYKINPEEGPPEDKRTVRNEMLEFMAIAKQVPGADMKYMMKVFASKFEWLDPKLAFPGEGAGRSPEKPIDFMDFVGSQMKNFPQFV